MKQWKETTDGVEKILYWDEYKYLNAEYRQEELTNIQAIEIGKIFLDLDIEGLRSVSDLAKINIGKVLSALIKGGAIFKLLTIILKRKDGNNLVPCTVEEFERGRMKNLKPFVQEVFADFFSLNSELYSGIASFWKEAVAIYNTLKGPAKMATRDLMNSISSLEAKLPKSKPSKQKRATT